MSVEFEALLDEGIAEIFFEDHGETVTKGAESLTVIFEHGVEVVDDEGTIDLVSYGIICKKGDFKRGEQFTRDRDGRLWGLGRLLTRDPDDRVQTYEVVPV